MKITIKENNLTASIESENATSFPELFQLFKRVAIAIGYSEKTVDDYFSEVDD